MSIIRPSFDELIATAWLSTLYFEILEIFGLLDSRCDSYLILEIKVIKWLRSVFKKIPTTVWMIMIFFDFHDSWSMSHGPWVMDHDQILDLTFKIMKYSLIQCGATFCGFWNNKRCHKNLLKHCYLEYNFSFN